jgi:hypothetical protein
LLGGHWVVLQSVAWMGMVVNYTQHAESLSQAVEKTFDGRHPCALCQVVKSGRAEEQKREPAKVVLKFEAVLSSYVQLRPPVGIPRHYAAVVGEPATVDFAPPTPPPLA